MLPQHLVGDFLALVTWLLSHSTTDSKNSLNLCGHESVELVQILLRCLQPLLLLLLHFGFGQSDTVLTLSGLCSGGEWSRLYSATVEAEELLNFIPLAVRASVWLSVRAASFADFFTLFLRSLQHHWIQYIHNLKLVLCWNRNFIISVDHTDIIFLFLWLL